MLTDISCARLLFISISIAACLLIRSQPSSRCRERSVSTLSSTSRIARLRSPEIPLMRNSRIQNLKPVRGWWRGRVQQMLHVPPSKIGTVLGLACTGHGASLALVTSEGALRSSVLDPWAGAKRILLLANAEHHDLRNPPPPTHHH